VIRDLRSVLQGRENLKYFPDNETRIVISDCQSNGSCKDRCRRFTMKHTAQPSAAAKHVQIKHRKLGRQTLVRSCLLDVKCWHMCTRCAFHPINLSTENPQNTHDHVWNSNYPCAPANAFPSSCRIPIPFRHCLNQSTQMVPDACDSVRVLGVFRTMHETTSRFAAQLHRIFGCSSIAESSP